MEWLGFREEVSFPSLPLVGYLLKGYGDESFYGVCVGEKTGDFGTSFDLFINVLHHVGCSEFAAYLGWIVLEGQAFGDIFQEPS